MIARFFRWLFGYRNDRVDYPCFWCGHLWPLKDLVGPLLVCRTCKERGWDHWPSS